MPDVAKLVALSKLMDVSLDYLLRDEEEASRQTEEPQTCGPATPIVYASPCYEYKSRTMVGSWPLVHIKFRPHGLALAKGVVAIGNSAVGCVAVGGMGVGVVCVAGMGAGIISLAGVSLGLLAFGGLSDGLVAIGGVAIGGIALGAVSIGRYAFGATVIAETFGAGAVVRAPVAVAEETDALHALTPKQADAKTLAAFLDAYVPEMPRFLRRLLTWL